MSPGYMDTGSMPVILHFRSGKGGARGSESPEHITMATSRAVQPGSGPSGGQSLWRQAAGQWLPHGPRRLQSPLPQRLVGREEVCAHTRHLKQAPPQLAASHRGAFEGFNLIAVGRGTPQGLAGWVTRQVADSRARCTGPTLSVASRRQVEPS